MSGFAPMQGPYYTVCLLLVMLSWVFFTLAFTVFRPKTPGASAAAPTAEAVTGTPAGTGTAPAGDARPARDRRSIGGVVLQFAGYFLMWFSARPSFMSLSKLPGPVALVVAAAAVALAWTGSLFAYWAQRTLGKEWSYTARLLEGHRLVTAGPYAIVRHPIYTSMLVMWIATALAVARPWGIALGIVPMVWGTLVRVNIEDGLLRQAFGPAYEEWKKETPAMIPGLL
jgi:protein-S-isoprenylcysteine O-methyltransferase Ste14